jgi:hypothetical protein
MLGVVGQCFNSWDFQQIIKLDTESEETIGKENEERPDTNRVFQ